MGATSARTAVSLTVLVGLLGTAVGAFGQEPVPPAASASLDASRGDASGWQLYWENDSFIDTDLNYTNGLRFVRSYSDNELARTDGRPWWAGRLARLLPARLRTSSLRQCSFTESPEIDDCHEHAFAWAVGQNMYTPSDLTRSDLLIRDRPYAGYLYFGGIGQLRRGRRLHEVEIDVGVVGPIALAGPLQSGWHDLLRSAGSDTPRPQGWRNQLRHEPALQLHYEVRQQALRSTAGSSRIAWIELLPRAGVAVGTIFDRATAGGLLRLGYNLPDDFGPHRIDALAQSQNESHVYVFVGGEAHYVAYNKFLDGNFAVFGDSHSVHREAEVTELEVGISIRWARWPRPLRTLDDLEVTVTRVERSDEFAGQRPPRQQFLSLNLSYRR